MRIQVLFCLLILFGFESALVQAEVPLTHSKEYQIVLKNEYFQSSRDDGIRRVIDRLQDLEDNPEFDFKYKTGPNKIRQRHTKRYDTLDGRLQTLNLKLMVEQSTVDGQIQSKLKVKYNCMDVDVCYDRKHITSAFPYPAPCYEAVNKMKLEADVHQNYTKYALSSTIKVAGVVDFATVGEATHYFKGLKHVKGLSNTAPLVVVYEHYEWVFDNIKLKVKGDYVCGEVVVRYATTQFATPTKVELSLKIKKPKKGWHYETLVELGQVYHELLQSDLNMFKGRMEPGKKFYRPADSD